jgi:hypothetical protein
MLRLLLSCRIGGCHDRPQRVGDSCTREGNRSRVHPVLSAKAALGEASHRMRDPRLSLIPWLPCCLAALFPCCLALETYHIARRIAYCAWTVLYVRETAHTHRLGTRMDRRSESGWSEGGPLIGGWAWGGVGLACPTRRREDRVGMYVCICMYTCVYVCMYVCVYVYVCICLYVWMDVCICMYTCIYVYVRIHVCTSTVAGGGQCPLKGTGLRGRSSHTYYAIHHTYAVLETYYLLLIPYSPGYMILTTYTVLGT